jgi:OOP family OmpA-OmpF porin
MKRVLSISAVLFTATPAVAQIGAETTTDGEAAATAPAEARRAPTDRRAERPAQTPDETPLNAGLVLDARPGMGVATGLFRNAQATGLPTGTFGLSLMTEFYTGADTVRQGDDARRFAGHLGLSWTPIDHLEVFASLSARATTNTLGRPELIQSVGDTSVGAKGFFEVSPGIHVGALGRLNFPAGANQVGFDFGAIGVDLLALLTIDLRPLAEAPVRFHLNAGYLVDRSSNLFPFVLERVERFGQNVYDYNRFHLGFGIDAPLDYVTPSLEWTTEFPTGAGCDSTIAQPCITDNGFSAYPSWLTVGLASAPFRNGIALHAGMDIGVTTAESQGTPAIPAWNLLLGFSYNLNPQPAAAAPAAPPQIAEAAPRSFVRGRVVDGATGTPIEGARIAYRGLDYSAQITDAEGAFRSLDFDVGDEVVLEISAADYTARTLRMNVTDEVREGTIELQQSFSGSRVSGTVRGAGAGSLDAVVDLRGPESHRIETEAGAYRVDVTPGEYYVTISAPGYISSRQRLVLSAGQRDLSADLRPLPAGMGVRVTGDAIKIDDSDQRIAFDGPLVDSASQQLLDQIAQLMTTDTSLRVTVVAHTDDTEDPSAELSRTEERAATVRDYLLSRGIAADRLDARGAGATEPRYPNVSDRNRLRNNRVEFLLR